MAQGGMTEKFAKWLAAVIENGEAYEDYENMDWAEFSCEAEGRDAFLALANQALQILQPEIIEASKERIISFIRRNYIPGKDMDELIKDIRTLEGDVVWVKQPG